MKRIYFLWIIAASCIFTLISCRKGDTGSAGPQGPQGAAGATGADGTQIFSGQGAPGNSLGQNGDFYIDLTSSGMYGPKTDAGWGTAFSLKGSNGANGSAGSKIYSGAGVPNNSAGVAGDYFMSTDMYLLYGPKTNDGWGTPVNLKGPKGDKGDPGQANVIYSDWQPATDFGDTIIDATTLKVAYIGASQLNPVALNQASIQVFINFGGGPYPLPYTSAPLSRASTISFLTMPGRICITRYTHDRNVEPLRLGPSIRYRYIIIPGSIKATAAQRVDLSNYNAVARYFKMRE
ncbi:hypothetical protein ABDK00_016120 [Niabella insulamsoli]|uniref:hypothetical protein n=1 Tax=Niabella insulamsoli TaxID=3144874 RepID=UPI0031FC6CCC